MKNKGLIIALSCTCMLIVALVATIIVLASGTQNVGSNVSLIFVASDIAGSVSGTYQVGNNPVKDMTTSSGSKTVFFGADEPESLFLLSPNETINMLYGEDVILTYTFTSAGEQFYAHISYSDTDTPYTNLVFNYKKESDSSYSTNASKLVTVPRLGTATFSVKISIENSYLNASLNGTIDWALTKEEPIVIDDYVNLNVVNNAGSKIDNNTFSYQTRTVDGKNQFKIVGATPIIDSSSTSGYINGYYDRTTLTSTGKVSSINDLTNNNGAEFFYFCTNPAVVGSTGHNDPGEIYYTSTSDTDLESWYDIPTTETQLYTCFMTPNYTSEVDYSGSDTKIVISNNVENIPYKAFYQKSITDVVIPQSVKNIGYGTSNTGYGVFYNCSKLKKVFIPNSVTSIGDWTFYCCSGLTSIIISDNVTSIGNYAFSSCSDLTSITIPDSVTSIGSSAFSRCSSLTSITIPGSVTYISNKVFSSCTSLTSLIVADSNSVYYSSGNCIIRKSDKSLVSGCNSSVIPNDVKDIGFDAFYGFSGLKSVTIPDAVTSIGSSTFYGCSGLTSITIPGSVTSILSYAFQDCTGLTSLNFIYGLKSILWNVFQGCSSLESIIIPDSVTSIGNYAFHYCSGLTSITIGSGVTSIGKQVFSSCSSLTSITIPDSVISIGAYAFSGCSSLESITIPESVTSIEQDTFFSCSSLTSVLIPDSVTSIGSQAFSYCSKLTDLTLGSGVTSIGQAAFYGCSGLTSITIPDSVLDIKSMAFYVCSSLNSVTIGTGVTNIGSSAFYGCSRLASVIFADTSSTWTVNSNTISVTDSAQNATYLRSTYRNYAWTKNS